MPTFVLAVAPFTPLMLPKTSELFCETCAFAPTAVAFVRLSAATVVFEPSRVLPLPVGFGLSALLPTKVLFAPGRIVYAGEITEERIAVCGRC